MMMMMRMMLVLAMMTGRRIDDTRKPLRVLEDEADADDKVSMTIR